MIVADLYSTSDASKEFGTIHTTLPNNLITKIKGYQQLSSINRKIYTFRNMHLEMTGGYKRVTMTEQLSYNHNKNYLIVINKQIIVDINNFPMIDKYHTIVDQKIEVYIDPKTKNKIMIIDEVPIQYIHIEASDEILLKQCINHLIE